MKSHTQKKPNLNTKPPQPEYNERGKEAGDA